MTMPLYIVCYHKTNGGIVVFELYSSIADNYKRIFAYSSDFGRLPEKEYSNIGTLYDYLSIMKDDHNEYNIVHYNSKEELMNECFWIFLL